MEVKCFFEDMLIVCIVCGHSYSFENERVSNNLVSRLLVVQTKGLHVLIMGMNDIVNLRLK